jgi:CheY-like chemotaxis protein
MAGLKIVCWGEAERLLTGRDSFLRREDCEVLLATSAREVLTLTRRALPGLVLIDEEVAGTELRGLCRALKANRRTASIPLVVVVANADDPRNAALAHLGVEGVLYRPTAHGMSKTLAHLLGVNAREYPRFAFEASARVETGAEQPGLPSKTLDLSAQGAQLEIEHPLQLGSELTLELPLPGKQETLRLRATVVRIMADPLWGRNRLGLRFLPVESSTRERLESLLLRLAQAEERVTARPQEPPSRHLF